MGLIFLDACNALKTSKMEQVTTDMNALRDVLGVILEDFNEEQLERLEQRLEALNKGQ